MTKITTDSNTSWNASFNRILADYSNPKNFVRCCIEAGFTSEQAVAEWDKAIAGGMVGMIALAQSMTSRGIGLGGTENDRRCCTAAGFFVLAEVREMLAAQ
tara:strand:+ start:183 stop:485 length:303 start_codon:yes stop_codon:yes gene_type:complete